MKGRCMATSEGKYDDGLANDFADFIGQDANGMDTTISLAVHPKEGRVPRVDGIHGGLSPRTPSLTRTTLGARLP